MKQLLNIEEDILPGKELHTMLTMNLQKGCAFYFQVAEQQLQGML